MDNKKEFVYDTDVPIGKQTVDRPPREFNEEHERALEALQRIVNANGDTALMPAPHVGERMSQRATARKILAGRSYQAVQAWLNRDPMPAGMVDWLLNDLQRVDAGTEDRMVRVADDEIAIVVRR